MHSIPIRLSVTQIICTKCNILSTFNSFLFIWGLFHLLYFKIFVSGIGSYCFHYRQQIYHKLFWLFNKNNSVIYRTHHKNSCPNDVTAAWATRIPWSINQNVPKFAVWPKNVSLDKKTSTLMLWHTWLLLNTCHINVKY